MARGPRAACEDCHPPGPGAHWRRRAGPGILPPTPIDSLSDRRPGRTGRRCPMPITLTCPKCNAPQTAPDEAAGKTVRCPTCQAEFPADPATRPPAPAPAQRWVVPAVLTLAVLGGAGLIAYLALGGSNPTDFTDPDGMFTARFPNPPDTRTVSEANPLMLRLGERVTRARAGGRDYSVTVLDGVNAGDQPYGPDARDTQINEAVVLVLTNTDGQKLLDRPVAHEGHPAREVVLLQREDGKLTALRVLAGEHQVLRLAVTGSGDKDKPGEFLDKAGEFFTGVHVGPAVGPPITEDPPTVSAADLVAAYRADAKAADAKYKDHWVRVTGSVREMAEDGTGFQLEAGGGAVVVRRAAPARRTVPVRAAGQTVAVTGKCRGLDAEVAKDGPRVVLEDAIVAHPGPPKGQ